MVLLSYYLRNGAWHTDAWTNIRIYGQSHDHRTSHFEIDGLLNFLRFGVWSLRSSVTKYKILQEFVVNKNS